MGGSYQFYFFYKYLRRAKFTKKCTFQARSVFSLLLLVSDINSYSDVGGGGDVVASCCLGVSGSIRTRPLLTCLSRFLLTVTLQFDAGS